MAPPLTDGGEIVTRGSSRTEIVQPRAACGVALGRLLCKIWVLGFQAWCSRSSGCDFPVFRPGQQTTGADLRGPDPGGLARLIRGGLPASRYLLRVLYSSRRLVRAKNEPVRAGGALNSSARWLAGRDSAPTRSRLKAAYTRGLNRPSSLGTHDMCDGYSRRSYCDCRV